MRRPSAFALSSFDQYYTSKRILRIGMRHAFLLCNGYLLLCDALALECPIYPKPATKRLRHGITGSHTESGRWVGPPYRGPQHHVWECAFLCELAHSGRGARLRVQGRPWNGEGPRMDTGAWERHAHNLLGQVLAVGEAFFSSLRTKPDLTFEELVGDRLPLPFVGLGASTSVKTFGDVIPFLPGLAQGISEKPEHVLTLSNL